ncbi:hypothetical protein FOMPIDRAFT_1137605, partial [Fomitopsis schrenkii]
SVRQKIREGAPGYVITADLLPNFLHACGAQGRRAIDQNNLEKGLFYSKFLVKAIQPRSEAPSIIQESDADLPPPLKRPRKANTRRTVASLMHVHGVTSRAIAYVGVQEHFALSSSHTWSDHLEEFDYIVFYNNIVDYFECAPGPEAQARVDACLKWWNEYALTRRRFSSKSNVPLVSASQISLAFKTTPSPMMHP